MYPARRTLYKGIIKLWYQQALAVDVVINTAVVYICVCVWYIYCSIRCCSGKQYYQLTVVTRLYWHAVCIFTSIQLRVNREADTCKTCKIYALSIVFLLQYQTDTHVILKGVAYMHIKFFIKHIAYRGVDYLHACADVYLQFPYVPWNILNKSESGRKIFCRHHVVSLAYTGYLPLCTTIYRTRHTKLALSTCMHNTVRCCTLI